MAADELESSVVEAVRAAGKIVVQDDKRPRNIRHKGRIDLVTETDLAVEKRLKDDLAAIVPEAGFLAEETAGDAGLDGLRWVIDPVDGTTNFAHGLPMVATSVALCRDGAVELGVVNLPLLGECFHATRGRGARLNGEPISVSGVRDLQESLVATGFPYAVGEYLDRVLDNMGTVLKRTQGIRRAGAAAVDLAWVACGRYDGFYEPALNPWDVAAGWLLVEEAGGQVTRYGPVKEYALGSETILATNGRLHAELGGLLRS